MPADTQIVMGGSSDTHATTTKPRGGEQLSRVERRGKGKRPFISEDTTESYFSIIHWCYFIQYVNLFTSEIYIKRQVEERYYVGSTLHYYKYTCNKMLEPPLTIIHTPGTKCWIPSPGLPLFWSHPSLRNNKSWIPIQQDYYSFWIHPSLFTLTPVTKCWISSTELLLLPLEHRMRSLISPRCLRCPAASPPHTVLAFPRVPCADVLAPSPCSVVLAPVLHQHSTDRRTIHHSNNDKFYWQILDLPP